MKGTLAVCVCAMAVLLAGAALGQAPAEAEIPKQDRGMVIGAEDTVTISVLNAEELSKPWRVNTAGDLNLPLLGRMAVAGLTVEQLERELDRRLRKYYHEPQVSVFLSEIRSQPVTVVGPVERPGTHQLQGSRSLFGALLLAGGPKESAGSTVKLSRPVENGDIDYPGARLDDSGKFHVVELELKDVMEGRGAGAAIDVQPHDVIAVSEFKQQRLVYISGEVTKPGAVELVSQETVSLMKVIAVAGGLTRTASAGRTMIVHLNEQGVQSSTAYVDVNKIMSGKAKDLELTAGDVVIVPTNTMMSYLQAASLAAITTGVYVLARF